MELFMKLFENKNGTKKDSEIDLEETTLEADWAIYLTTLDENQLASILVDLSLTQIAPIEDQTNLICVSIQMNFPREDGLSSSEESRILNQIEDEIISSLTEQIEAVYVGRINSEGKIRSHFYSGEEKEELEKTISNVKSKYHNYKIEIEDIEDKDWSIYFEVLYPHPIEMQSIQNTKVIKNLEKHGDSLEKERLVEHWIYFKTETDREQFLNEIKDKGFEVVEKDNTDDDELKFSLQLSRLDKVDYQSVDDYVLYLWETAQDFNGDYDGWETFVIRD
jgi:uncharacterized protein (TIGR01619 family)